MTDIKTILQSRKKPQLILIDVDGTLMAATAQSVPPAVAKIIKKLRLQGVKISLCTGRYQESTADIAKSLGLDTPQISENGARIFSPTDGRTYYRSSIPPELYEDLVKILMQHDKIYVCLNGRTVLRREELNLQNPAEITAITLGIEGADNTERLLASLRKNFDLGITTTNQREELRFVVITSKDVNKGTAAAKLMEMLKIPRENTVAIGDGDNDVPMFRAAGLSIAMGNATSAVQAQADIVAAPQADGGLEKILTLLSDRL